jgi:hypothetical protein
MYAPQNEVSVKDGPHKRRWSHNIIILYYNTYHCVTTAYSIQYSNMLYSLKLRHHRCVWYNNIV